MNPVAPIVLPQAICKTQRVISNVLNHPAESVEPAYLPHACISANATKAKSYQRPAHCAKNQPQPHSPAKTCPIPPTQMAGAARKIGIWRVPRVLMLTSETVKMEMPRQKKPNGVGLANLRCEVAKDALSWLGLHLREPARDRSARGHRSARTQ